jgi:hypothetical protein
MIKILKEDSQLLLSYTSENTEATWIDVKLKNEGCVTICRIFSFNHDALVEDGIDDDERTFILGVVDGNFYKIDRDILGLKHDLLLANEMAISKKTFIAYRDISVFGKIDDLIDEPIVVGGDAVGSIPISDFEALLKNFPNTTELSYYANARIARTLKEYLGSMSDAQQRFEKYLQKKQTIWVASRVNCLMEYEYKKFEYVRDELRGMLKESDAYTEKDWQKLIIDFLLLIFPKYIAVLENLHVKDFYSTPHKTTDRFIDLTLVDANGAIDIIEIKKPFANCLLSRRKYRDNYTPRTELSGSVMQVEKYLFHLNKWGRDGERDIMIKRKGDLPRNFDIKITNPKGMIILGRDYDFADDQKFDFEIIKRKYANVMDIMTYDDLLRRLDNIISMLLQKSQSTLEA